MPQEKQKWDWCSWRWGVVTKAAGCPDVTLHILRHSCASRLIQRRVDLFTVSKWLGHSSMRVTERYVHLAPDSLDGALSALLGKPTSVQEGLRGTQRLRQSHDSTDLVTLKVAK
jgi:integrase